MLQIYYHTYAQLGLQASTTYSSPTFGGVCVEQQSVGHRSKETGIYHHHLHKTVTSNSPNSQSAGI